MSKITNQTLESVATSYDMKVTKREFREHMVARDALVKARALEQAAAAARAAWAPDLCPWVGFLDDRASGLRDGAIE